MKRNIFLLLILLVLINCFACFKEKEDPIEDYTKALIEVSYNDYYLYEYEKSQETSGYVSYNQKVTTYVSSYNPIKAKVVYEEKTLNEFPSNEQYTIINQTKYYDGQNVILEENNELKSINDIFEIMKIQDSVKTLVQEENFTSYNILNNVLTIDIDEKSFARLFNASEVSDVLLDIELEGKDLSGISLKYKIGVSNFVISYEFSKEEQNVIIPNV